MKLPKTFEVKPPRVFINDVEIPVADLDFPRIIVELTYKNGIVTSDYAGFNTMKLNISPNRLNRWWRKAIRFYWQTQRANQFPRRKTFHSGRTP